MLYTLKYELKKDSGINLLDNVNVGGNIIKMNLKEIRIVGVFVRIRVEFLYERRGNFRENSGCTKPENNLKLPTSINLSKMATEHRFSYTHSGHLDSFNLISQKIVFKNNYVSAFMTIFSFFSV